MERGHNRFEGRREFFGSLIYDRTKHKYIYLNQNATDVLDQLSTETADKVYSNLLSRIRRDEFDEFIRYAREEQLLDEKNRFDGKISDSNFLDGQLSAPEQVYYGITYTCPGRCIHCYTDSDCKQADELDTNETKQFINELSELGVCRVSIDGGEPLCRNDIFDVIEHMKEREMDVSMTTNAWLVNEEKAMQLSKLGLKTLTVSFDGGTRETFEYIRGVGSFERTIKGARLLRDYSEGRLALRLTLMKPNKEEIPQIIEIAENLGYDTVKINPIRLVGRAEQYRELEITREDFIETVENGLRLRETTDVELVLPLSPIIFGSKTHINLGEPVEDFYLGFGCVGGLTTCYVSPRGDVTPCCFLGEEFVSGNLHDDSFKEIWDYGEGFKRKRSIEGHLKCYECDGYENCEGGCRTRAIYTFGNINAIDPYCLFLEDDEPCN
jgi:radical SAM protein with 4Fe4S-binding SPASM domain